MKFSSNFHVIVDDAAALRCYVGMRKVEFRPKKKDDLKKTRKIRKLRRFFFAE